MYGYNTLCEVNLQTGRVSFFKLGSPIFAQLGMRGELPPFDVLTAAYLKYGVDKEDQGKVGLLFDRNYLMNQLGLGESVTAEYRNEKGIYGETKIVKTGKYTVLAGFTEMDREINDRHAQLYTDSLTKVKNRKYYDDSLSSKICNALAISDIDCFKSINDSQGHLCGDVVLAAVAAALRSSVRESDEVVRYGGDEFLITFQNITRERLESRMEEIRRTIEEIRMETYPKVRLSMSFGVVFGTGMVKATPHRVVQSPKL